MAKMLSSIRQRMRKMSNGGRCLVIRLLSGCRQRIRSEDGGRRSEGGDQRSEIRDIKYRKTWDIIEAVEKGYQLKIDD